MPPPLEKPSVAKPAAPAGADGAMPKLKPAIRKPIIKTSKEKTEGEMPRLTRAVHWQSRGGDDAYTSVHVNKEHKEVCVSGILKF